MKITSVLFVLASLAVTAVVAKPDQAGSAVEGESLVKRACPTSCSNNDCVSKCRRNGAESGYCNGRECMCCRGGRCGRWCIP
ncbi:hypothetical protein BGZ73_007017 [Actinomortierella ambigua]|nr:hypothetical protein BGZ73_007017 [Actinomortierella ambigua]